MENRVPTLSFIFKIESMKNKIKFQSLFILNRYSKYDVSSKWWNVYHHEGNNFQQKIPNLVWKDLSLLLLSNLWQLQFTSTSFLFAYTDILSKMKYKWQLPFESFIRNEIQMTILQFNRVSIFQFNMLKNCTFQITYSHRTKKEKDESTFKI